jgi:hypothetical protein
MSLFFIDTGNWVFIFAVEKVFAGLAAHLLAKKLD